MELIAKIPLLLLNIVACQICCSSPNPPPKEDEVHHFTKQKNAGEGAWFMRSAAMRTGLIKLIDLCEALIIASMSYPTLSIVHQPHLRLTPLFVAGSLLMYVATALRVVCYSTMGKHFTFHLAILKDHSLVTTGPYSLVRHPAYTGITMYFVGLFVSQLSRGSLLREVLMSSRPVGFALGASYGVMIVMMAIVLLKRIPLEDGALKKHFGTQWEDWARKTPYSLIPFVY